MQPALGLGFVQDNAVRSDGVQQHSSRLTGEVIYGSIIPTDEQVDCSAKLRSDKAHLIRFEGGNDQAAYPVEQYSKQSANQWLFTDYTDRTAQVTLAALPITIALAELYE